MLANVSLKRYNVHLFVSPGCLAITHKYQKMFDIILMALDESVSITR